MLNYFENNVKNTIEREHLLDNNDIVVLGVSGGADSVSLLSVFCKLRGIYNLDLRVCHINHKIRPGSAERDAYFVKDLCEKFDVPYFLKEAHIPELSKQWNMSEEEAGRQVRYDFFREIAGSSGKIATAHNKNDNVETVVMRFIRGAGIAGLNGIQYKRDNIIRPLLDTPRCEIEKYLEDVGLTHITDETNLEDEYTRNKVRHNLIPYIMNEFNPNFTNTLSQNITLYKEDYSFIHDIVEEEYSKCFNNNSINILEFKNLHSSIQKRIIIKAVREISQDCQFDMAPHIVESIINLISCKNGAIVSLKNDYEVVKQREHLIIKKKTIIENTHSEFIEITIIPGEYSITLPDKACVKASIVSEENIVCTPLCVYIPYDNSFNLLFRTVKDGDKFRIDDNKHQKLKKLYSAHKVKNENRYMLVKNNEVLWIPNVQSTRWKNRSGKFLKLEITKY